MDADAEMARQAELLMKGKGKRRPKKKPLLAGKGANNKKGFDSADFFSNKEKEDGK